MSALIDLLTTIKELHKDSGITPDMMDIGCTLTEAMTEEQINDLAAMMDSSTTMGYPTAMAERRKRSGRIGVYHRGWTL